MPTYKYKCTNAECAKDYLEHRDITHPQWMTHCDICGTEYTEVTE